MKHDPIFQALPSEILFEISRYIEFDIQVSVSPWKWFNSLQEEDKKTWLDHNRATLEEEFCRKGSWSFGTTKSYAEIVRDLASKMDIVCGLDCDIACVESSIVAKVWNDAVKQMTPEQVAALRSELEQFASKYGKTIGKEFAGFAALSAAQLSGFGVYLLGSTILGAINGALGLGLTFSVFTGLSSLISVVIGPVGWVGLGLATVVKLGAPNYKKILPAVILIAASRQLISERDFFIASMKASLVDQMGQSAASSVKIEITEEGVRTKVGSSKAFDTPWAFGQSPTSWQNPSNQIQLRGQKK